MFPNLQYGKYFMIIFLENKQLSRDYGSLNTRNTFYFKEF